MGFEIEEANSSERADYQTAFSSDVLESMKDLGSLTQKLASDGAKQAAAVLPELSLITGGASDGDSTFAGNRKDNAQSADDLGVRIEQPANPGALKPGEPDLIEIKPDKTDTNPVDVF